MPSANTRSTVSRRRPLREEKDETKHNENPIRICETVLNVINNWPDDLKNKLYSLVKDADKDSDLCTALLLKMENEDIPEELWEFVGEALNRHSCESHSNYFQNSKEYSNTVHYINECDDGKEDNKKTEECKNGNKLWYLIPCLPIIVLVLIAILSNVFSHKEGINDVYNEVDWERNIMSLQDRFPSQNSDMWFNILSGIKTVVTEKPVQPSVILFLYNDKRTSACLANEVGKEAVKFLGKSQDEPIVIKGGELRFNQSLIKDYGLFTEIYKNEIERKHVIIILDLQDIPAILARTFHALCDVENPLVSDAAILFTLQIDGNERLKPTAIAENKLRLLWKDTLDIDIMDPLITRVTNAVLPVKIESNLSCSMMTQ